MLKLSLTMSLFLAACASVGDFNDLAEPLCLEERTSAQWLLDNGERNFMVALNVYNELAGGC